MKIRFFSMLSAMFLAMTAFHAQAEMTTDAHGNVGYDTAAECDAAVQNGSARFYESFTHKKPLIRKGEKGVQTARIRDLGPEYAHGACDMGVGHKLGRDGVSVALQGKYIPFSPDMPVNAYTDATGAVVRVTMQQCDNWFSGNAPRPVNFVKASARPAEPAVEPAVEPVVQTPAVAVVPAVTAAPVAVAVTPYVFGTIGVMSDGVRIKSDVTKGFKKDMDDSDTRFAGQVGLGVQINNLLGGELFYQGSRSNYYEEGLCVSNRTFGVRATLGSKVGDNTRLFAKAGAVGVKHGESRRLGNGKTAIRPTAGFGVNYSLTDNVALRADYDHHFKLSRSDKQAANNGARWKGSNYLGAGVQYHF